jgi:hypothetical protein
MLGRVLASTAAAAALCLMLSGCVGPSGSWQFPQLMTPPPPPAYETHRYAPPPQTLPSASESGSVSSGPHESTAPRPGGLGRTETPPPSAPPAEAAPQPTVTLAGDGAAKDRALRLLDSAGAQLAKVDRSKLSRDSAATYDQANDFLNAGRKAAIDQDYVAATGYAEKASVLASKLASASQ